MKRIAIVTLALWASGCVVLGSNSLSLLQRQRPLEETVLEGEGRAKVLVIDVHEVITDSPSKRAFGLVEEESTVGRVVAELDKAAGDDRVKAVVLRMNSPGGGVTASDEIYTELLRFKQDRKAPIVASFGDMATSGGYYIACAADRIVASPTTITGSIGVILMNLNLEGLLGKIGVKNQIFKAGEHKDLLSPFRPATPEEKRIVQTILDNLHGRFIAVVREARPQIEAKRVHDLTDGRILDAGQAQSAGLVDDIGDLRDAVEVAKKLAGLQTARVVRYARTGESPETVYSRAPAGPVQVNLLPVDLGALSSGPRFMYIWAPGLSVP